MAVSASGYWSLDGIDLWDGFKTALTKGSTDLLRYPSKKESIEYNWLDQHGIDVDLSNPKFSARQITLTCLTICDSREEFWDHHNALINQLMLPGIHSLRIAAHGFDKVYGCEYRETGSYEAVKSLRLNGITTNVHQFSLTLRETEPEIGASASRIMDEEGRLIIT